MMQASNHLWHFPESFQKVQVIQDMVSQCLGKFFLNCAQVVPIYIWLFNGYAVLLSDNVILYTVVLEKTLESPLDCKEIKPVNLKEINLEYSLKGLMLELKL